MEWMDDLNYVIGPPKSKPAVVTSLTPDVIKFQWCCRNYTIDQLSHPCKKSGCYHNVTIQHLKDPSECPPEMWTGDLCKGLIDEAELNDTVDHFDRVFNPQ